MNGMLWMVRGRTEGMRGEVTNEMAGSWVLGEEG